MASGEVLSSGGKLSRTRFIRNAVSVLVLLFSMGVTSARGDSMQIVQSLWTFRSKLEVNCTLPSWDNSSDHCSWPGITCNASGAITRIQFSGYNCSGEINEAITNITTLEKLDLSWNSIAQKFPIYLTELPNLQELDLGINNLTGELPPEIGNFTSLELL
ncbi:hypothetical protein CBR_g561 [Chara braunii]|uniref:Leucine-rich repeat-containing N-terminal plant-type domain-containing protein n=1 Tax=Chara braunii TaxID=69332 RepID=A0A388KBP2_CHABU|nr:hypothetical protein CBR_g561 [Chara braunii]|eukprot:GBG67426.1 hypothetical protein CBR_g561 [Chara braunii]